MTGGGWVGGLKEGWTALLMDQTSPTSCALEFVMHILYYVENNIITGTTYRNTRQGITKKVKGWFTNPPEEFKTQNVA